MALQRLISTERRLNNNPELKRKYHEAMEDFVSEGYVQKLKRPNIEVGWYLPHHPVISDTKNTKVRIVFDSAAKVNGISLNDLLEKGPNLLNDLTGILLRFRKYRYAIAGDISKMFLQILLHPEDQVFHRFLWRENPRCNPEFHQFKTIIFSDAASPFLACYILKRVLEDHNTNNAGYNALNKNLYMDDLLQSCSDITTAKEIVKGTCEVLNKGGFLMRNWISNDHKALEDVTEEKRKDPTKLGEEWQKVLGLNWDPISDAFKFRTTQDDNPHWTKRSVVSLISKIFDPCGFLAPFLVTGKILMQDLWRKELEWYEQLDEDILNR